MPRFKLTIEYQGTRYSGWQVQRNARTVQGELQLAVREATGRTGFELYGAGRTDAGVHALAQVAHLQVETGLKPQPLQYALNDALPQDINVLAVERVPTASMPAMGPWPAATCTRSRVGAAPSARRSCGGSATPST